MEEHRTVSVSEFKATCLRLFDEVRRNRRPILVTRRGEPIALVSPPPAPAAGPNWLGSMRDSAEITGDLVDSALPAGDWERGMFEGWERAEEDGRG